MLLALCGVEGTLLKIASKKKKNSTNIKQVLIHQYKICSHAICPLDPDRKYTIINTLDMKMNWLSYFFKLIF